MDPDVLPTRKIVIAATAFGVAFGLVALAPFVFRVLLVVFAAVLFAILLNGMSLPLRRFVGLKRVWSVPLAALLLIGLFALFAVLGGPAFGEQLKQLVERLPESMGRLRELLQSIGVHGLMTDWVETSTEGGGPDASTLLKGISGFFSTAVGALTNMALVLIVGLYLAINPDPYLRAIVRLTPPRGRARAEEILAQLSQSLHWWFAGQLSSMAVVGVLTGIGLWLIDMPLVFALALIAGLFGFVPYIGPIAAAVPAVLIGLAQSPVMALYAVLVYVVVQIMEGNFITPFIQERAVALPPAALLVGQVLMGVLFGLAGLLLATPLAVVAILLVQMLYVHQVLKDPVPLLGASHGEED